MGEDCKEEDFGIYPSMKLGYIPHLIIGNDQNNPLSLPRNVNIPLHKIFLAMPLTYLIKI